MTSKIFHSDERHAIEPRIKNFLNSATDVLSAGTAMSPRAAGDAMQELLSANFKALLGPENCAEYSESFARRAMADLAFTDPSGLYYVVDVKTHRLSTKFNMPNLTSVERLARFYEEEKNYFVILMLSYEVEGTKINVHKAHFIPVEFLDWSCLTIGALGWGQLQIANSNIIAINDTATRRAWMLTMCDELLEFYPKEIGKIGERITYFERIKETWLARPDR
jgi:hypothetical protein